MLDPFLEGARGSASQLIARRHGWFLVLWMVSTAISWGSLSALVALIFHDERYTHIAAIPLLSIALLYSERHRIFTVSQYRPTAGVPLMLFGGVIFLAATAGPLSFQGLSFSVLALVLTWIGAFICCYGLESFRGACFPLLFLLWMVPLPTVILDKAVMLLQAGSAQISYILFRLAGVPVWRHGLGLSLPGVAIEIAPQCSGIRSAISLFISGLVTAHFLLPSRWKRVWLMLCIVPVLILKNAIRIVSISLLGLYWDRRFLFGNLHRYGGLPFSLVGLAMLAPVVWLLWRSGRSRSSDGVRLRLVGGR